MSLQKLNVIILPDENKGFKLNIVNFILYILNFTYLVSIITRKFINFVSFK